MSKKLLLVLFMGFTIIGAKAQSQKHTIGIQGGAFLKRTLTARAYPDAEIEVSPAAGIFYRYMFNKRFGINAGILYRKVYDNKLYSFINSENAPDSPPIKLRHNYFNAPIHLVVNLNRKEEAILKVNFLVGVSLQKYLRSGIVDVADVGIEQKWTKFYFPATYTYADGGIELGYAFNQKYSLSFNPGYRYQLFDSYRDKGFYGLIKLGRSF